jgi:ubiquinone/menaquinone biosynthesis C-methylase UbiE
MGTAEVQGQVWGVRARDWAEVQEGMYAPLFDAVLRETEVGASAALLDVGCGSDMFCRMAAELGAQVSGLDAAEPLLAIARERTPQGDFRTGEMEELPYADHTFDVVAGFNSFQFAASPVHALQEARRVARPGACLVITVFGKREDTEATAYFAAVASLLPPPPPSAPDPFCVIG